MRNHFSAESQIGLYFETPCPECENDGNCPIQRLKTRLGKLPRAGTIDQIGTKAAREKHLKPLLPDDPTSRIGRLTIMTLYCLRHRDDYSASITFYQTMPPGKFSHSQNEV